VTNAAHALNCTVFCQCLTKGAADELAVTVGIQYHAADTLSLAGRLKREPTKLFFHIVSHCKAYDLAIIVIKNRRDIDFSVYAGDLWLYPSATHYLERPPGSTLLCHSDVAEPLLKGSHVSHCTADGALAD